MDVDASEVSDDDSHPDDFQSDAGMDAAKPIYGMPQAGRRLQRRVVPWLVDHMGLRRLSDFDENIYVYDDPANLESLFLGVYVDDLQIAHSATVDEHGDALDFSSFYHHFVTTFLKFCALVMNESAPT
jgi:hypothetical protein